MGKHHGYSSTAQQPWYAPSHDAHDRDRTLDEARRQWAVAACERCGRSAVLGEPMTKVRLYDRDALVCPDCLAAPAQPTWVAAPDRQGRRPVRLVAEPGLRPVAAPIEPPDEQAA
jgi:hypothetical protein